MLNINYSGNKIIIKFNNGTDLLDFLDVLYFFINCKDMVIEKITLKTLKNGFFWYRDLTSYAHKPLLITYMAVKEEFLKTGIESTHIDETVFKQKFLVEILVDNLIKKKICLLGRKKLLDVIYNQWLSQL